jgi:hypothetical protein
MILSASEKYNGKKNPIWRVRQTRRFFLTPT